MRRVLLISFFLGNSMLETFAQNKTTDLGLLIEERVMYVAENGSEGLDFSALTEVYWQYIQHPISLTFNNIDEIQVLQLLTFQQIESLKGHLFKYESLLSLYELQIVPHFDIASIKRIEPFITISKSTPGFNIQDIKQEFVYRMSYKSEEGLFPKKHEQFLGSPFKQNLRYRFNSNSLRVGLNAENDAGEPSFKTPNTSGYDFYSGYVSVKNIGVVKELIVGDFQANFGQGLAMWSGFGFGKSSNTQLVAKVDNSVRPYSSSKEYEYLRGFASHVELGKWSFYPFMVLRKVDANVVDTINGKTILSSVEGNGLHRTENELSKKDQSKLTGYGLNTSCRFKKLKLGLTLFQHRYQGIIMNDASLHEAVLPENKNQILRGSVDFLYAGSNGIYFGEIASNQYKNLAGLFGTTQAIGKYVSSTVLFRAYDAGYVGAYKNPFADGAGNNESGLYWGNEIAIDKKNTISVYTDLYRSNWASRYVPALLAGKDLLLKWQYTMRKKMRFYVQYRKNTEEKNEVNIESVFKPIAEVKNQTLLLHVRKQINKAWLFQARFVAKSYNHGVLKEQGRFMYQELSYNQKSWTVSVRYTNYHTDGYNSRVYAYEKDVLYSFNTPAYFGAGNSMYILIKKKISSTFQLWVKFANNRTKNSVNLLEPLPSYTPTYHVSTQIQLKF